MHRKDLRGHDGGDADARADLRFRRNRAQAGALTDFISHCNLMQIAISQYNDTRFMSTMTTVQVDLRVKGRLDALKMHSRESYNEVLQRILEDLEELDPEVRRRLDKISKDVKAGKFTTHEKLKRELGL